MWIKLSAAKMVFATDTDTNELFHCYCLLLLPLLPPLLLLILSMLAPLLLCRLSR